MEKATSRLQDIKTPNPTSAAIVLFIARLSPVYQEEPRADGVAARSLRDGTLVLSVATPDEGDLVEVWWQGDRARTSLVRGTHLARLALVDYIQVHGVGMPEQLRAELLHLSNHFSLKIGLSLEIDQPERMEELLRLVSRLIDKFGTSVALEALKKLVLG